jgi:hypothetical protein
LSDAANAKIHEIYYTTAHFACCRLNFSPPERRAGYEPGRAYLHLAFETQGGTKFSTSVA